MKLRVLVVACQHDANGPLKSKESAGISRGIELLPAIGVVEFIQNGLFADLPAHLGKHKPDVLVVRTHGHRQDGRDAEFDVPLNGLSRSIHFRALAHELLECFSGWRPRVVILEACHSIEAAFLLRSLANPDMVTIGFEGEPTPTCLRNFHDHLWEKITTNRADPTHLEHGTWVSAVAEGSAALGGCQENVQAPRAVARLFPPGAGSLVWGPRDPQVYGGAADATQPPPEKPAVSSHRLQPTLRNWASAHLPFFTVMTLVWLVATAAITALIKRLVPSLDTTTLAATTAHAFLVLAVMVDFVRLGPLRFTEEGASFYAAVKKRLDGGAPLDVWARHGRNAIASQEQFFGGICVLLTGWLLLYGELLTRKIVERDRLRTSALWDKIFAGWQTAANNLATLGILISFCVMSFVTTPEVAAPGSTPPNVDEPRKIIRRIYLVGALVWLFLLVADVASLTVRDLNPGSWGSAQYVYDVGSGLLACVAFALLVGRFDSKFIDASPGLLVLLYCYAAIQPLWILAAVNGGGSSSGTFALLLYVSAMVFKALFYPFLRWLMQSGRLLFYFGRVRDLYESVHVDWKKETSQTYSSTRALQGSRGRAFVAVPAVGLAFALLMLLGASSASLDPPPAVIVVGSGTTASFLRCEADVKTDLDDNPRLIMLPGGTETGYNITSESNSHGKFRDARLDLIGLSFGDPDESRIEKGNSSYWAIATVDEQFPLGILVHDVALDTTSCVLQTAHVADIRQCVRTRSIVALWETRVAMKRAGRQLPEEWLVTDMNSGTRKIFDEALEKSGLKGDPRQAWNDLESTYTMDYANVTGKAHVIAFGLPSYNSGVSSCKQPDGVDRIGVCEADEGPCKPKTVRLSAYFRFDGCGPGAPCPAALPVCEVLLKIYAGLGNDAGEAWARRGCKVILPDNPQRRVTHVDWGVR
jgi:hypothetical protein